MEENINLKAFVRALKVKFEPAEAADVSAIEMSTEQLLQQYVSAYQEAVEGNDFVAALRVAGFSTHPVVVHQQMTMKWLFKARQI